MYKSYYYCMAPKQTFEMNDLAPQENNTDINKLKWFYQDYFCE